MACGPRFHQVCRAARFREYCVRCRRAFSGAAGDDLVWQENPSLPHVCINIEYSQIAERLLSVQINYTWHLTDFPWVIHVREGQLRQFANEMAEWLKKYDEELQARRSNS